MTDSSFRVRYGLRWFSSVYTTPCKRSSKTPPDKPYIVNFILSLSSADAATNILLAFFTISALFAIHIDSPREDDPADKFLSRHLPGILLGVGLGCFFGTISLAPHSYMASLEHR